MFHMIAIVIVIRRFNFLSCRGSVSNETIRLTEKEKEKGKIAERSWVRKSSGESNSESCSAKY